MYTFVQMYVNIHVYTCICSLSSHWDVDTRLIAKTCPVIAIDRCCHVPVTSELDLCGASWLLKSRATDPLLPNSVGLSFCASVDEGPKVAFLQKVYVRPNKSCSRFASCGDQICRSRIGATSYSVSWRTIVCMRCRMWIWLSFCQVALVGVRS